VLLLSGCGSGSRLTLSPPGSSDVSGEDGLTGSITFAKQ
jgi:hypothetical protein